MIEDTFSEELYQAVKSMIDKMLTERLAQAEIAQRAYAAEHVAAVLAGLQIGLPLARPGQ